MPKSPHIEADHVTAAQNQKEVTGNEAVDELDESMNGKITFDYNTGPGNANYDVSGEPDRTSLIQKRYIILADTGPVLTGTKEFIIPTNDHTYFFFNNTTITIDIKITDGVGGSTGTGTPVTAGARRIVYCDGSDVFAMAAAV